MIINSIKENKLNFFIKKKNIKNILLITGKKSLNFSGFKKLLIYRNFKSIMKILYKRKEIPEISELKFLIKKINNINPDLIIALGGGCVIDYAKLANTLYDTKNLEKKIIKNKLKLKSKKTQILAIPTTAGSGAEVTKFSVIYINKIKYSVENNLLKPDFYSLIPKLVINSPKIIRASSGFDAIAQAVESIFSKKGNSDSLKYSSKSLKLSIKIFLEFVNNPSLYNSDRMLRAANFSGKAINISRTNAPHAFSYLFSSKYKILHGIAVSIFFIEIINLYYSAAVKEGDTILLKKFNVFFNLIKQNNIIEFNNLFQSLFLKSGIKKYLYKYLKNITYQDCFDFCVNPKRIKNSPIKIRKKDISHLYLNKFYI
jgi:alcohol dehydrogenase class IV